MIDDNPMRKAADTWSVTIKASIGMLIVIGTIALCAESSKEPHEVPATSVAAPK